MSVAAPVWFQCTKTQAESSSVPGAYCWSCPLQGPPNRCCEQRNTCKWSHQKDQSLEGPHAVGNITLDLFLDSTEVHNPMHFDTL